MDKRIKQKIENGAAAHYERTRAAGDAWTLFDCKKMIVAMYGQPQAGGWAMYGVDAEQVVHDYFVRLFGIVETRKTWNDDMVDSLREYWARDPYEVPADVQSQFAPTINDRSNKE